MGSACCSGSGSSGTVAQNRVQGSSSTAAANKYKLSSPTSNKKASPQNSGAATTHVSPEFQDDTRARARDRAEHAMLECFENNETVVPPLRWRRQHLKTPGMGTFISGVVGRYLARCNDSRVDWNSGSAATTTASSSSGGGGARGGRHGNKLPTVAQGGQHSIVTLDFRGMRIGDDGLAALAPALLADTRISNVLLAHNDITDRGVGLLEDAIRTLRASEKGVPSAMELLILADNPISSDGLARLSTNVLPYLSRLDRVEVGEGQMGPLSPAGANGGASAGGFTDVEGEILTPSTVQSFIDYIHSAASLATFVFKGSGNYYSKTGFSPEGMQRFVQQVVGRSSLAELYLQECYTTKPATLAGVSSPFKPFQKRREKPVDHAGNSLNNNSGAASQSQTQERQHDALLHSLLVPIHTLSEALCTSTTALVTLVLRIPLCDEAMVVLSRGLSSAPRLENLSLRGCDLSANGLQYVAQALERNRSLVMLDVSFQSNMVAHPAVLAEARSSLKKRQSTTNFASAGGVGGTLTATAEAKRMEEFGESVPTKEQREHPLLPLIQALHTNRTLVRLVMLGINISISDIEELCACIEVSHNRVLCEVAYTNIGVDALNTKLETFLSANSTYGSGSVVRQSVVSPSTTAMNSTRYRSISASSVAGGAGGGGTDSLSESMRNSISLSDAFGTYGSGPLHAVSPKNTQPVINALPRVRSTSRASSPSVSMPSLSAGTGVRPPLIPRASMDGTSTDDGPHDLLHAATRPGFDEHYVAFRSGDRTDHDDEPRMSPGSIDAMDFSDTPNDLSRTGRLY